MNLILVPWAHPVGPRRSTSRRGGIARTGLGAQPAPSSQRPDLSSSGYSSWFPASTLGLLTLQSSGFSPAVRGACELGSPGRGSSRQPQTPLTGDRGAQGHLPGEQRQRSSCLILGESGKPARVIYRGLLFTASCETQDANCSTNCLLPLFLLLFLFVFCLIAKSAFPPSSWGGHAPTVRPAWLPRCAKCSDPRVGKELK